MDRTKVVFGHLNNPYASSNTTMRWSEVRGQSLLDRDDDIVVVSAKRTPICKAKRGGLKDTFSDDMLATAFKAVLQETGIHPTLIGDMAVGNVNLRGAGALESRFAQFYTGIPETVPIHAVNRQCSSGLQAVMSVAGSIRNGVCDIGMAGGFESLTSSPMGAMPPGFTLNPKVMESELTRDVLTPMGITSENVAEKFGVSREKQDKMAMESHQKAAQAQARGWFDDELAPVKTILKDKDGNEKEVVISKDDGVRPGTNMEILRKLKPAFKPGGSTTAGNSSQVSDGAAAVLLATREAARRHNLPVLGVIRSFALVGVPPAIMGIGPAYAIPEAVAKAGLTLNDIDVFEINEAFASQAVYCVEKLRIPMEKVNPKGGAIALGHPLGCTGARQVGTLLHELKRRGKKSYGVISMCMGTGMGAAAVFEYPGRQ